MTSAATAPAWFLRHNDGEVHGPYLLDQIILAAVQGNVATDTEVRHEKHTQNRWIRASRIKQIATAMQSPLPLQPPTIDRTSKQANPAEGWQPNKKATAGSTAVDTDPFSIESIPRNHQRKQMIVPPTLGAAFFAIFDFRFRYFVTPWIVRAQWAIFVSIVLMLMALVLFGTVVSPVLDFVASNMPEGATDGSSPSSDWSPPSGRSSEPSWTQDIFQIVSSSVGKAFGLVAFFGTCVASMLYVRLLLESVIVFFRIAEDMSSVNDFVKRYQKEVEG